MVSAVVSDLFVQRFRVVPRGGGDGLGECFLPMIKQRSPSSPVPSGRQCQGVRQEPHAHDRGLATRRMDVRFARPTAGAARSRVLRNSSSAMACGSTRAAASWPTARPAGCWGASTWRPALTTRSGPDRARISRVGFESAFLGTSALACGHTSRLPAPVASLADARFALDFVPDR